MATKNEASAVVTAFDIAGMQKKKPIRLKGTVQNQFGVPGTWLRGTLHCHLNRPGLPEWRAGAALHYRKLGYDFIAGMDHDEIVDVESSPDLLVIPGAEISCGGHLLALGITAVPEVETKDTPADSIAAMVQTIDRLGGVSILAHPFKTGYRWDELQTICQAGLHGIEVVNSNVRGKTADSGRSDQLWHNLLREGFTLTAFGNDDAHGPHEDITQGGWSGVSHVAWTGVLVEEVSQDGVLDAMRKRRTYASEGPEITGIVFDQEGMLNVTCSPCIAGHLRSVGGSYGGTDAFPDQDQPTAQRFVFDLSSTGYRVQDAVVIMVQDKYGRRAWTSPITIERELSPR